MTSGPGSARGVAPAGLVPADPESAGRPADRRPVGTQPGRRELAYAVLACGVGAALALFATTRSWAVELVPRMASLPPRELPRTGGDLLPWLPGLALVGLAGVGALPAVRGLGRRLVGVLLVLTGVGLAGSGGYGGFGLPEGAGPGWPALCAGGGILVATAGALAVVRGSAWPAMGTRYERASGADRPAAPPPGDGRSGSRRTLDAWDALDRGEDPTVD